MQHWVVIILLAALVSCGKPGKTQSELQVISSFAFSSATHTGGAVVVGRKSDGSERFSRSTMTGSLSLELTNGTWEFFVIVWSGDTYVNPGQRALTGTHHCGYGSAVLSGGSQTVAITADDAFCSDQISGLNNEQIKISQASFVASSQFLSLKIASCNTMPSSPTASDCSGPSAGASQSLRVSIPDTMGAGASTQVTGAGLVSRCLNSGQYTGNYIKVPVRFYQSSPDEGVIPLRFESYSGSNCQGTKTTLPVLTAQNDPAHSATLKVTSWWGGEPYFVFLDPLPYSAVALTVNDLTPDFAQCITFTVTALDTNSNPVSVPSNSYVSVTSSGSGIVYYTDASCSVGAQAYPPSVTLPQGNSSVQFSARFFKQSSTVSVTLGPFNDSAVASYNSGSLPSFGTITQSHFNMMSILASYNLPNAHTQLTTGSRTVSYYNGTYQEMAFTAVSGSSLSFNYRHYDSGFSLITNNSSTLTNSSYSCLDMDNNTVANNTSNANHEWCYNNLYFLNPQTVTGNEGIFIISP